MDNIEHTLNFPEYFKAWVGMCHWDPENLIACTRPNLAEVCYPKLE